MDAGADTTRALVPNTWQHLVFTFRNQSMEGSAMFEFSQWNTKREEALAQRDKVQQQIHDETDSIAGAMCGWGGGGGGEEMAWGWMSSAPRSSTQLAAPLLRTHPRIRHLWHKYRQITAQSEIYLQEQEKQVI